MTPAPASSHSPIRTTGVAEPRWRRRRPSDVRRCIALVLLACGALASGLLAACAKTPAPPETGGTPPTHLTTTTAPTTTTAAPTTSAPASLSPELQAQRATALAAPKPVKPTEATENTQQGAASSVAYFFTLYRHAFVTGDTTDLAAMSEEGCVFCRSTIDDATKLHKDGGWANPWTITLHDLSYIPPDEGKEYSGIKGKVDAEASTVIKGNGEVVEKSQETISMFVAMKYVGGGWVIKGVSVE